MDRLRLLCILSLLVLGFGSTAAQTVLINEINYHAAPEFDTKDWLELHNPGATTIDVSGWTFSDEDDANRFVLPAGTLLPAGGFLVLCRMQPPFPPCTPIKPASAIFRLTSPTAANCSASWMPAAPSLMPSTMMTRPRGPQPPMAAAPPSNSPAPIWTIPNRPVGKVRWPSAERPCSQRE